MAIPNKEGRAGAKQKTNRPVSSAGIQIDLRLNAIFGDQGRQDGHVLIRHPEDNGGGGRREHPN